MFNNKFYKQIGSVDMGSPLGPALANMFKCNFENKWLKDCPHSLRPVLFRRYVDILLFFSSLDRAESLKVLIFKRSQHKPFVRERKWWLFIFFTFLDVNLFCEKIKFVTSVYRKKIFSGVYTNFNCFIPKIFKTGLIKWLLFRCFSLCLDFVKLHHEMKTLKNILCKNSYPCDYVDEYINKILHRVLTLKVVVSTVPKKDLMTVLPYLGKPSLQVRTRINRAIKKKPPLLQFRTAIQTEWKLVNFFTKLKFLFSYLLALFTNLSVVAAMLN